MARVRLSAMGNLRAILGPLKVLDAVHRAGGITRAAAPLHLTSGAVSQQLKQLETLLDLKLFQKEGREARLTEVGQILAVRAGDSFDQLEQAIQDAVARGRGTKKLRIKVMPTFAIKWLIPRLASLYSTHRDIDIEITTGASATFDTPLDNFDFVLRHGTGHWPQMYAHRVFYDAYVPVCSAAIAENLKVPSDLLEMQLLHSMMNPTAWQLWFEFTGVRGVATQPGLTLSNAALCYQAAIDGLGVAMGQLAYVQEDLALGRLVQPFGNVARTGHAYYLVCDASRTEIGTVATFAEWLCFQTKTAVGC